MLPTPRIIDGRYRIDRLVGEGGFGEVYAGVHLALGAPLAVKVLRLGLADDAATRAHHVEKFLEEGRLLTRLRHPNIVAALDLGVVYADDGTSSPYLVMEWVEGVTLREHMLMHERAFTPAEAWAIFEPLADALAHAHASHVVHRDLTPSNVMIVRNSAGEIVPRVIDFGVAKAFAPDDVAGEGTLTAAPNPYTPAYAAPEHITHARTGPWTDVHALGLLFVELVTGAPPYGRTGDPRHEIVDPVRPSPRTRGLDVGPLEPVLAKALALRPAERFANAGELLHSARDAMRALGPAGRVVARMDPSGMVPYETAAPASRTLRDKTIAAPNVGRRAIVRASLAGVAVLAVAGGAIVVPRLRARGSPVSSSPRPSASAIASVSEGMNRAPASLTDLLGTGLVVRAEAAGYAPTNRQEVGGAAPQSVVGWTDAPPNPITWEIVVAALRVVETPGKTHAAAHLDAAQAYVGMFAAGASDTVAYGADDRAILLVVAMVKRAGVERAAEIVRDKIAGAIPLLFRGVHGSANDPAGARVAATGKTAITATRLHDLTYEEMSARLLREGAEIIGAQALTANMSSVSFMRASKMGYALSFTQGGKEMLASYMKQPAAIAYASSGDDLVVIQGEAPFTTRAFLARVVAGLPCDVREIPGKAQ